jgi:hypothetical protein
MKPPPQMRSGKERKEEAEEGKRERGEIKYPSQIDLSRLLACIVLLLQAGRI